MNNMHKEINCFNLFVFNEKRNHGTIHMTVLLTTGSPKYLQTMEFQRFHLTLIVTFVLLIILQDVLSKVADEVRVLLTFKGIQINPQNRVLKIIIIIPIINKYS